MKTTIILFVCSFALLNTAIAQNNIFEKGKSYMDLSLGLGIYNVSIQKGERSNYQQAVAFVLPLNYEYALLNQVGIGFQYRSNNYLSKDSLNKSTSKSKGFFINNNLHLLNNSVIDIYLGISYGVAFYRHSGTSIQEQVFIKGAGFSYLTSGGIKSNITKKLGVHFSFSYDNYSFGINSFKINNVNQLQDNKDNYNANLTGVDVTLGMSYKISQ